jgi:hypothetical protein
MQYYFAELRLRLVSAAGRESHVGIHKFITAGIIFLILLLSGCAGLNTLLQADKAAAGETAAKVPARKIQRPYDLKSLLTPVVQFNYFSMSFDYFNQFVWDNDYIFPDYLFRIFKNEFSNYKQGQGTTLTATNREGRVSSTLNRALLKINEDGSKWWQVAYTLEESSIFYEVLVTPEGVPLQIHYLDPETGRKHLSIPQIAMEFAAAKEEIPIEDFKAGIETERVEELEREWSFLFAQPEIIGEEIIEVKAGKFMAVHLRDGQPGKSGQVVDYWISPDVAGSILKITFSFHGEAPEYTVELTELKEGFLPLIDEEETVSSQDFKEQGFVSEGSPDNPVELTMGEPYYGTVGAEGISYYKANVKKRADIYIEAFDLLGYAELIYYGRDSSFQDWSSSSQGDTLNIEDYFVKPHTTLYFSIVDYVDEYSNGESYTIIVTDDYLLSPTGIMMRGEIYNQAFELKTGHIYSQTLNREALNYYQATVKRGPNLRITVKGLPLHAELFWLDTSKGSYESAYTSYKNNARVIEVMGLKPDTECFFYIAGDTEELSGTQLFEIKAIEFRD